MNPTLAETLQIGFGSTRIFELSRDNYNGLRLGIFLIAASSSGSGTASHGKPLGGDSISLPIQAREQETRSAKGAVGDAHRPFLWRSGIEPCHASFHYI